MPAIVFSYFLSFYPPLASVGLQSDLFIDLKNYHMILQELSNYPNVRYPCFYLEFYQKQDIVLLDYCLRTSSKHSFTMRVVHF